MAKEYAKILLTIWNDPDFQTRSGPAQWLYFVMLTHPTLNSCGVMEWREPKLIKRAKGVDIATLRHAAWELAQVRLVAVDPDTEEALVRSYVRHDGVLKSPNMVKAMVREHGAIASLKIKELVSREVRRAYDEHPEWKGRDLAEPVSKQFMEPFWKGSILVPDWFRMSSDSDPLKTGEPFRKGSPIPQTSDLNPSTNVEGSSGAADATPGRKPRRGTRIPEPFVITDEMAAWARAETPGLDHRAVTARFEDYWRGVSGSKGIKLDWTATWRNWLRKEHDERGSTVRPLRPPAFQPGVPDNSRPWGFDAPKEVT